MVFFKVSREDEMYLISNFRSWKKVRLDLYKSILIVWFSCRYSEKNQRIGFHRIHKLVLQWRFAEITTTIHIIQYDIIYLSSTFILIPTKTEIINSLMAVLQKLYQMEIIKHYNNMLRVLWRWYSLHIVYYNIVEPNYKTRVY